MSPQLPVEFVQKILQDPMIDHPSVSQTPGFEESRFAMMNGKDYLSADHLVAVADGPAALGGDVQRTYLHLAAMLGDPILLCEMIRLGATVDISDATGKTPLFLAVESVETCKAALDQEPSGSESGSRTKMLQRLHYVIRILLQQHANTQCTSNGLTPFHIACRIQDWELIALLLEHGADPLPRRSPGSSLPSPPTFFRLNSDKLRFRALVSSAEGSKRPPRMCPCFSGKTLADCHDAEDIPYPTEFICRCGSRKIHRKCCGRRKLVVWERWDEKEQWILPSEARSVPFPVEEDQGRQILKNIGIMKDADKAFGISSPVPTTEQLSLWQRRVAEQLSAEGLIDPAFAYAMASLDFVPRPQGRTLSRHICTEQQGRWNSVIDDYILSGKDRRPKDEVERAAKIGTSNGALYRQCEGKGCDKTEGQVGVKLRQCTKCKIAVYCSRDCQNSVWKSHKGICRTANQFEQALPSQKAFDTHVTEKYLKDISSIDLTPPPEIQALINASLASKARN